MGTWGKGLFDGDAPLDRIGAVSDGLERRVVELGSKPASAATVAELGALLGILLQISPYSFSNAERAARLQAAVQAHSASFADLSPDAAAILRRLAAGEGAELAERDGARRGTLRQALGAYLDGKREPALFEAPAARAAVQEVAASLAGVLDRELDAVEDLYEADCLGLAGLLLLLEPWQLDSLRVEHWRDRVRAIYASMCTRYGEKGGDMEFFKGYLQNAERAFAQLLERAD